jgi:hypothetical protein
LKKIPGAGGNCQPEFLAGEHPAAESILPGRSTVRHMTSCSFFQEIMAGLDLTYKMGFADRLRLVQPYHIPGRLF